MALTTERINDVKQKTRMDTRKPGVTEALRALFKHMEQLSNPDLQLVNLDFTANADIVVADVACKLYGFLVVKPAASTTDAWIKGSDHATTAAANGDVVVKMLGTGGGGQAHFVLFADGLKLGTGLTMASHTTVNGNTDSSDADACVGFAIIGAA